MANLSYKSLTIPMVCLIILCSFIGTASSQQASTNAYTEVWAGELTGMVEGTMTLNALAIDETKNELTMESKIKMKINRHTAGFGKVSLKGTLKGRIKDGLLQAIISGYAHDEDGRYRAKGPLIGTLSETQGFGTYSIFCNGMYYKGEWTLEKQ
jgi:hypothetical protein